MSKLIKMENDDKKLQTKEQLCHIFNFGESTFCLVCRTLISGSICPAFRKRRVSNHLEGSDHKEAMRSLFKLCVSDPACDTNDETFIDIVTNSIFDISLLLGNKSSYICQQDKHLICLMCNTNISAITSSCNQLQSQIIKHLESDVHSNNIKEVCWYYRLDSKEDYLLFYKSVWHCSVCEVTSECEETELLQSAVLHLQSNSHKLNQHFVKQNMTRFHNSSKLPLREQKENTILSPSSHLGQSLEENYQKRALSHYNCSNEQYAEACFDLPKISHDSKYICSLKKIVPPTSKESNIRKQHSVKQKEKEESVSRETSGEKPVVEVEVCSHGFGFLSTKKVFDKCIVCLRKLFVSLNPSLKKHANYLSFFLKFPVYVCKVCNSVFRAPDVFSRLTNYADHCGSQSHTICLDTFLKRKLKLNKKKAKEKKKSRKENKLPKTSKIADDVKHTLKNIVQPASQESSERKQNAIKLEEEENITRETSGKQLEGKDEACLHGHSKNKVFDKCISCLRKLFVRLNPSMERHTQYLMCIRVPRICICKICKTVFNAPEIYLLIKMYTDHCKSQSHIKCLNTFLKTKPKLKNEKAKSKLKLTKETKKQKVQKTGKKHTCQLKEIVPPESQESNESKQHAVELRKEKNVMREVLGKQKEVPDIICSHRQAERTAFDKCTLCWRKVLVRLDPSMEQHVVYLMTLNDLFLCKVCRNVFRAPDIYVRLQMYMDHCKSQLHATSLKTELSKHPNHIKNKKVKRKMKRIIKKGIENTQIKSKENENNKEIKQCNRKRIKTRKTKRTIKLENVKAQHKTRQKENKNDSEINQCKSKIIRKKRKRNETTNVV